MKIFRKFDLSHYLYRYNIDFLGIRHQMFFISLGLILASILSFIMIGLNLGIDFTGGVLYHMKFENQRNIDTIRDGLSKHIKNYELQRIGRGGYSYLMLAKGALASSEDIKMKISSLFEDVSFLRVEYVGPKIGKYLKKQALMALLFAFGGIILYVGIRFKSLIWGIAGVVALLHDVIITLGMLSVLGREINIVTVAALLTLGGYSVNDTIVVFDRIRENLRILAGKPLNEVINFSINRVLPRTLGTSFTTLIAILAILIFGGEPIKNFAIALLIGVIIGTYSSIYIATPIAYQYYTSKRR